MVLDRLGVEGEEAVLVEDLEKNLPPAKELGMRTILVGRACSNGAADYVLESPEEIPSVLPGLSG